VTTRVAAKVLGCCDVSLIVLYLPVTWTLLTILLTKRSRSSAVIGTELSFVAESTRFSYGLRVIPCFIACKGSYEPAECAQADSESAPKIASSTHKRLITCIVFIPPFV